MNRAQALAAHLKSSLLVFFVLSAAVAVSILDARPKGSLVAEMVRRMPASLPKISETPKVVEIKRHDFEVFEPPCLKSSSKIKEIKTDSRYLRMASSVCGREIVESRLENASNGFEATVFVQSSKFTTDFVPLVEGPNDFKMKVKLESGAVLSYEFQVTRAIASN